MDFLSANVDIFEKVLSYLDLNDVLKCCSICKSWYYNTNINSVWKRFCEKDDIIPEHWDWKVTEDDWKLDFPCEWKIYYMNCRKTVYNWKNNKFKINELKRRIVVPPAYDGKTLIVETIKHLYVYKTNYDNLDFSLPLSYKDIHIIV